MADYKKTRLSEKLRKTNARREFWLFTARLHTVKRPKTQMNIKSDCGIREHTNNMLLFCLYSKINS